MVVLVDPFIYSDVSQSAFYLINDFTEMATIKLAKLSIEELKQLASIFDLIFSKHNHFIASHKFLYIAGCLGSLSLGALSRNGKIFSFSLGFACIVPMVFSTYENNAQQMLTWKNRTLKILDLKLHPESF